MTLSELKEDLWQYAYPRRIHLAIANAQRYPRARCLNDLVALAEVVRGAQQLDILDVGR